MTKENNIKNVKKEVGTILRYISKLNLEKDEDRIELKEIAETLYPDKKDLKPLQKMTWNNDTITQKLSYCIDAFKKHRFNKKLQKRLEQLVKTKPALRKEERKITTMIDTSKMLKIAPIKREKKKKIEQKIMLEKILVIGPQISESCHFSESIRLAFVKLGKDVRYVAPNDLYDEYFDRCWKQQKHYPLSSVLQKISFEPDLIVMDECNFLWKNDVNVPVFYHHREYKRPPEVDYPDVIFFWHDIVMEYFEKVFAPFWMYNVPYHEIMPLAIDTEIYKPQKKKYKGVCGIGFRETLEYIEKANEITMVPVAHLLYGEWDEFKRLGFQYWDTPISNAKYRELLPQCEALFVNLAPQQYLSHKMFETMACKTLCIVKLENDVHEQILKDAGFVNGTHYIGVKRLDEIKQAFKKCPNKKEIVKNAYEKILKDHTYIENAKYISELYFKLAPRILRNVSREYSEDPGDLNVLISTTERCGLSWFCRYISLIYERMYGKKKVWNTRISRLEAAHLDYSTPEGWNAVNYVPIKDVVKKKHDKIVLLQRKFESWKESMLFYYYNEYRPNLDYKQDKDNPEYKDWFDRIESYYNQSYAETDSKKVLRVYIEDLNNYTVATFHEILDFLGFSKEGRPILIPINTPERVWEAFSADFNSGDLINERLAGLHKKYSNTELVFKTKKQEITPAIDYITTEESEGYEITKIEREVQKGETFTLNPFLTTLDTLKILDKKRFDIICPVYWVNDLFVENVKSWVKEIPVNRIIFGINRPISEFDFEEMVKYKIRPIVPTSIEIQVIDQRKHKTLGICLAELMKLVKADWFVFLHADVMVLPDSFRVMRKYMKRDIGIIESARIFFDGKSYKRGNARHTSRAYSGFQLMRKEAIKDLIEEIEDDFIYRNEDLIFQARCKQKGFKYLKVRAWHIHQLLNNKWTFDEKDTTFMQWHGLVKYTQPDEITREVCWSPIEVCLTKWGQVLSQILSFTWQYNPNWGETIIEKYNKSGLSRDIKR